MSKRLLSDKLAESYIEALCRGDDTYYDIDDAFLKGVYKAGYEAALDLVSNVSVKLKDKQISEKDE